MISTRSSISRHYPKKDIRMNKKRASTIVASLFAGGLLAAACTGTGEVEGTASPAADPVKAVPVATTYTPPTATAADRESAFIRVLDSEGFPYGGDEDLAVEVGYAACEALDSGVPVDRLAAVILDSYTPEDGGVFLGASVYGLCPDNAAVVEGFFESLGGGR